MPSRILTAAHLATQSNNLPITVKHQRYWLAPLFLRPRPAILFFLLLLLPISSGESRSQTLSSSSPTAAESTERKVQPKIVVSEQTARLLADASPDKAIVANPSSGSSGASFLKRVLLFPLRLVRSIAGSFGEGRKSVASSSGGGSGEVVDSKIYGDEAGAKLPDETANAAVSSADDASYPAASRSDLFFDRPNLPARIGYTPLGAYPTLENHSDKGVIRYRLGCVLEENGQLKIPAKRKEEVTDLPPANISKTSIPFTALSLREIKKECSAKKAKIAVVDITFADGTTWKLEDDSRGGAVDLPINAVAVVNADKTPTMSSRDQFVRVLRFEVDGKPVRKSFRVSLFDNDKFVDLKTVKDGFILPAKFTSHEFVGIRFRIGHYDLFFDPVYRAKFETEWIVGVDTKPFDPDIVYDEAAKRADVVHYIEFESKVGDGTILLVLPRNLPPKSKLHP